MRIVASLLFFLLLILGIVFITQKTSEEIEPTTFLPADTLFYAEQDNGMEALTRFHQSRLGTTIADIDFIEVFQEMGLEQPVIDLTREVQETYAKIRGEQLVHQLVGKKIAVAMLPLRPWSTKAYSLEEFLKSHLLLISKPRVSAAALDLLTSYYTGDVKMTIVPYGQYSIKRFVINEDTLSVAFADGYVLASPEERTLREALDIRDRWSDSLQGSPEYRALTKQYKGAERIIYLALDRLRALAKFGAEHTEDIQEKAVLAEFATMKGFNKAAYGGWRENLIIEDKLTVTMDRTEMDPEVKKLLTTAPSNNDTLPFVAEDTLAYYWSNTLNLRLLWDMFLAEIEGGRSGLDKLIEDIQALTGHTPEELLDMLASNAGFVLRQSDRAQFVPIPDFALLIKLQEPDRVAKILKNVFKTLDISIQSRSYRDITYNSWGLYPQESLQPVYTIHRDYLIITNTLDIYQRIIDTPITDSALSQAKEFAPIDPGFQQNNNSVYYVDQATLFNQLGELISWTGTMIAIQDRQAAAKSKVLIDRLINPLLFGLAMFEKSATRTRIEDDNILIESRTLITP